MPRMKVRKVTEEELAVREKRCQEALKKFDSEMVVLSQLPVSVFRWLEACKAFSEYMKYDSDDSWEEPKAHKPILACLHILRGDVNDGAAGRVVCDSDAEKMCRALDELRLNADGRYDIQPLSEELPSAELLFKVRKTDRNELRDSVPCKVTQFMFSGRMTPIVDAMKEAFEDYADKPMTVQQRKRFDELVSAIRETMVPDPGWTDQEVVVGCGDLFAFERNPHYMQVRRESGNGKEMYEKLRYEATLAVECISSLTDQVREIQQAVASDIVDVRGLKSMTPRQIGSYLAYFLSLACLHIAKNRKFYAFETGVLKKSISDFFGASMRLMRDKRLTWPGPFYLLEHYLKAPVFAEFGEPEGHYNLVMRAFHNFQQMSEIVADNYISRSCRGRIDGIWNDLRNVERYKDFDMSKADQYCKKIVDRLDELRQLWMALVQDIDEVEHCHVPQYRKEQFGEQVTFPKQGNPFDEIVEDARRVLGKEGAMNCATDESNSCCEIAEPKFEDREDCKRFLKELYAFLREHYKSKIHTETDAINYILFGAKEGDAYYGWCKKARQINESFHWERGTFTTYCKTRAPKPKGLKRAAKGRAKKRLVTRELGKL